jgi:hypothetical protein
MTTEMWIIAAVRVAGSLPVLRWPFIGGWIAVLTDLSDLFLREWIHAGGVSNYQEFDKYLDQVYMLTFLAVALRWQPLPRYIAVALYAYRLAGFAAFEVTGERDLLLIFPNVFEFWFLFVAGLQFFRLERPATAEAGGWRRRLAYSYSPGQLAVTFIALLAAKEFQEYGLHYAHWLDTFTVNDAFEWLWDAATAPFRALS